MKQLLWSFLMLSCCLSAFGQQYCAVIATLRESNYISCGTGQAEMGYISSAGTAFAQQHDLGSVLIGGSCIKRSYKDCSCNEQPASEVGGQGQPHTMFVRESENGWNSEWDIYWSIGNNHGHGFHACGQGCGDGEEADPDLLVVYYNHNFTRVFCRVD